MVDAPKGYVFDSFALLAHFGAAVLAQQLQGAVVTGDPEFQKVAALVEVLWLPQR